MVDGGDQTADAPYLVPSHLGEGDSIGPIPVRAFFLLLLGGMAALVPAGLVWRAGLQPSAPGLERVGAWVQLPPPHYEVGPALLVWLGIMLLLLPVALPIFEPRPEFGAPRLLRFMGQKIGRNLLWLKLPPRHELADANGVRELLAVVNSYRQREALGPAQQPDLRTIRLEPGVVQIMVGRSLQPRAIYRMPSVNLDTASAETRRKQRAQWGGLLNALGHPLQVVVRATPATTLPVLQRIKAFPLPAARALDGWLSGHLHGAELVTRTRYLVVPAPDLETLGDRCKSLESNLRRIGLPPQRVEDTAEQAAVLNSFLTRRPGRGIGPAIVHEHASYLEVDGELVRSYASGKLPPSITTEWLFPLLDGDLAADVSIDIEPLDVGWAKIQLDRRRNALESSPATPGRIVALEQIGGLRMAYERRTTLPMRLTLSVVVRAGDLATLKRRSKRLQQRVRDIGGTLRLLRWEQRDGWLSVLPVRRTPLRGRGHSVETGTVARTYPWSAGTLVTAGGVPFGVAASSPVTFTVAQPKAPGQKGWRHMVWYGSTGSGKGYQLKVYLSRERFANGLRVYGIDQDEQQEYAGRFCAYLGGSTVPIADLRAAREFRFDQVANPEVVFWDLSTSDEAERGAIFAVLEHKLVDYLLLARRGRVALVVDEAVLVTESEPGRKALGELARRGRHFGIELHVLTQRVTDWFDTQIGRTVQGTAANAWYGQLEDRELSEIKRSMGLTDEECARIGRAGQGEGLLVTGGRRVWVNVYGETSPDEFAAFQTDRGDEDEDDDEIEARRNGHELVGSARGARA